MSEKKSCCAGKSNPPAFIQTGLSFLKTYQPILIVLVFSALFAWFLTPLPNMALLTNFMGAFLCLLSMFKFFNVHEFVTNFARYDMITAKLPAYGYIFPFLELGLGLALLSGFYPPLTYGIIIPVMGITGLGILRSLLRGEKLNCGCMGGSITLPLGAISILETFGMATGAAVMMML